MAKSDYLIVDGYNILHDWPELTNLMTIDLETARKSLMDTLAEYSKSSGVRVHLVFDAYEPKGSRTYLERKGIEVIFTQENETADKYIERLIDRIGRKSRQSEIKVASSDAMIQRIILGRGATRVSASELKQMILDQKEKNTRIGSKLKKETHQNLVTLDEENLAKLDEYIKSLKKNK